VHTVDDGVHGSHGKFRPRPAPSFDMTSGYAGTGAERSLVDGIAAPVLGIPQQRVPDVAALLFAPLARGTKVSVR
jgi:phospholipid/cholesterol/gamma-HCH transport system substrate-binding protein